MTEFTNPTLALIQATRTNKDIRIALIELYLVVAQRYKNGFSISTEELNTLNKIEHLINKKRPI
jgi:hypothetical protein